jgi:hypothetical protein
LGTWTKLTYSDAKVRNQSIKTKYLALPAVLLVVLLFAAGCRSEPRDEYVSFGDPLGSAYVTADLAGHIYVVNSERKRLFESGKMESGPYHNYVSKLNGDGKLLDSVLAPGNYTHDLASSNGSLYVLVDSYGGRDIFRKAGNKQGFEPVLSFRGPSEDDKQPFPQGIAVDRQENIYVVYGTRVSPRTILKFSPKGRQVRRWKTQGYISGGKRLWGAKQIAMDDTNELIHVLTEGGKRVETFTAEGKLVKAWGRFSSASSIAADPAGYLYVSDGINETISKFSPEGRRIARWPGKRALKKSAHSTLTATNYHLYVANAEGQIFKFTLDGRLVSVWKSERSKKE